MRLVILHPFESGGTSYAPGQTRELPRADIRALVPAVDLAGGRVVELLQPLNHDGMSAEAGDVVAAEEETALRWITTDHAGSGVIRGTFDAILPPEYQAMPFFDCLGQVPLAPEAEGASLLDAWTRHASAYPGLVSAVTPVERDIIPWGDRYRRGTEAPTWKSHFKVPDPRPSSQQTGWEAKLIAETTADLLLDLATWSFYQYLFDGTLKLTGCRDDYQEDIRSILPNDRLGDGSHKLDIAKGTLRKYDRKNVKGELIFSRIETEKPECIADTSAGASTAGLETKCGKWIASISADGNPRRSKKQVEERAKENFPDLGQKAFGRAWDKNAPKEWKKSGALTKVEKEKPNSADW